MKFAICNETYSPTPEEFEPAWRAYYAAMESLSRRIATVFAAALGLAFDKIRPAVTAETEAVAMALPVYLGPAQVTRATVTAGRSKLPLKGTAVGALALVADLVESAVAERGAAE